MKPNKSSLYTRLALLSLCSLGSLCFPSAKAQEIAFIDQTITAGIQPQRSEGIAVGDYNGDGFPDVYVTFAFGPNQLLRNDGEGGFTDVAPELGLALTEFDNTSTSVWGDFDNDGDLDLYIGCKQLPDRLFRNNNDGSFTNFGIPAGIGQIGWPKSINLADFNNDGWLDIYVSNFNVENALLLNDGDGTFTNHTTTSQALDDGTSMGVLCFDYGQDGDQDLLLIKDANQPTKLYENDGNAVFTEVAGVANIASESFGMGVDAADVNKDGLLDIYVTNLNANFLFIAQPDGTFLETGAAAGVDDYGMGWGCSFLDIENDGLPDLYLANEFSFSPYENKLFHNSGNGIFTDILNTEALSNEYSSWGCMVIDQDMDGRQDLLSANRAEGESLQFFRNETAGGNFLKLRLTGVESNSMGIGAAVRLVDNLGVVHYTEVTAGSGWESQKSSVLHFGLGAAGSFVEANVRWPSGLVQDISDVGVNQAWTVTEGEGFELGVANKVANSTVNPRSLPSEDKLLVAPNPWVSGSGLTISTATLLANKTELTIYSMNGEAVFSSSIKLKRLRSRSVEISAVIRENLSKGVYILSLINVHGIKSSKIVIR